MLVSGFLMTWSVSWTRINVAYAIQGNCTITVQNDGHCSKKESMGNGVNALLGYSIRVRLKSDSLSSIGPRAMGKGFGPSCAHFQTICPTLSTICCWLQWLEICLAICREVRMEISRSHCVSRGRSSGLSECWIFPRETRAKNGGNGFL